MPKRIALKDPERIARIACPVIRGMSKFFLPLVWLLTVSTNGVLRLLRINPQRFLRGSNRRRNPHDGGHRQ